MVSISRMDPKPANDAVVGKRVYLRKPSKRDVDEFLALNRTSTQLHRGLVSPPTNPTQFTQFLKRCRRADCACFLICRVADGKIVGAINLSQIFLGGFRNAYLGYYAGARDARQGYMTEAIQLMLQYAFTQL